MISLPIPLNFLNIFIGPILLYTKRAKLNFWNIRIGFFLISLVYSAIYLVINLILLPICWIKFFFTIPFNVVIKRSQWLGILILILWFFFGIFYLFFYLIFNDFPLFIKSLFIGLLIKDKFDYITVEEINLIEKTAKNLFNKKTKTISHEDFIELIKKDLEKINRKIRRFSILKVKAKEISVLQSITKQKRKLNARNLAFKANLDSKNSVKNSEIEEKINMFVEVDKLEVFSFLKQFVGINGLIDLKKLIYLFNQRRICKKFSLVTLDRVRKDKTVNYLQVVNLLIGEKTIYNLNNENKRQNKIFMDTLKNFQC